MSQTVKIAFVVALPVLIIGLVIGYVVGRQSLDREWREPQLTLSAENAARYAATKDADPAPKAGTRILRPMPLRKSRAALADLTAKDPVRVTIGSVGRDDTEGQELHLIVQSTLDCDVVAFSGVAYGFDAWGRPSKMNAGGEPIVAFTSSADDKIAPKDSAQTATKLRYADTASIALAQIDQVKCANGKTWARN